MAIPVRDLSAVWPFYEKVLGCRRGRQSSQWIDYDFFGHQLVLHQVSESGLPLRSSNWVDGELIPIPHFGVAVSWREFDLIMDNLKQHETPFILPPTLRFKGSTGEQKTAFIADPEGNHLEFKSFHDPKTMFENDVQA